MPITSRTLDSLIRLSQARAKLELRTIVGVSDAQDVVKLIQESIFEACYSEITGGGQYGGGGGMMQSTMPRAPKGGKEIDPNNVSLLSIPKQTKFFVERLRGINLENNCIDYQELVELGKSMNLQVGDFRMFVDKLNANGCLLKKSNRLYQVL